jgi:outer membrane protein with beta-barrel domain
MKAALILALFATSATSAVAQTRFTPRGYVTYGSTVLSATESFEAVTGESSKTGVGGGGALLGIWRGVFVDVGASQQSLDGERVFVDSGTVYKLGIPVTIKLRPIDLAVGWRFTFRRMRKLSPYAGVGASFISYKETSEFAASGENVDDSKSGAFYLAGADYAVMRWIHAGVEYRYRSVKGVLGTAGVSDLFNEDQLGGYAFALRISVGR